MEPDDSAALIRLLVSIATHQHTINQDLREWISEHRTIHEDLQELHKQQVVTNDRLAQLLSRMIPPSPNGHED